VASESVKKALLVHANTNKTAAMTMLIRYPDGRITCNGMIVALLAS